MACYNITDTACEFVVVVELLLEMLRNIESYLKATIFVFWTLLLAFVVTAIAFKMRLSWE